MLTERLYSFIGIFIEMNDYANPEEVKVASYGTKATNGKTSKDFSNDMWEYSKEDGKVYINDSEKPLKENYLKEEWIKNAGYDTGIDYNSGALNFYVPKKGDKIVITDGVKYLNGKQIVLKDSYLEGVSESTKSVPDGEYKVSEDCYFLMGDNRNDSWDCRYWSGTNYVSEDDILARAVTGYLPWRGFYTRPDYE